MGFYSFIDIRKHTHTQLYMFIYIHTHRIRTLRNRSPAHKQSLSCGHRIQPINSQCLSILFYNALPCVRVLCPIIVLTARGALYSHAASLCSAMSGRACHMLPAVCVCPFSDMFWHVAPLASGIICVDWICLATGYTTHTLGIVEGSGVYTCLSSMGCTSSLCPPRCSWLGQAALRGARGAIR